MQVRCIKAFGNSDVGEIVSGLPDGSMVDPEHWEIIADVPPPPAPAPVFTVPSAAGVTPKEGM